MFESGLPSTAPPSQCEKCRAPILPGSAFCAGCGSPLAAPGPTPLPEPERQKNSFWVPVKLISVPIVAVIVTRFAEANSSAATQIGYWIGLMLVPLLISLAVVKFRPGQKIRTFSTCFCCIGLFGLVAVLNNPSSFARHEKTSREIVQEALGAKPIDETASPSEQAMMRVSRELVAGLSDARKKHDADAAPLQPVLATLYTPASFQSRKNAEQAIAAVNTIAEVDGQFADKIEHYEDDARARLEATGLTSREKEDFMTGVHNAYMNSDVFAAYRDVRAVEEQWRAATIDLYSFVLQHAASIKVKNRKISIVGQELTDEFNTRLRSSRDLNSKMDEANQRLGAAQSAGMQKFGITKSDLGLDKQ